MSLCPSCYIIIVPFFLSLSNETVKLIFLLEVIVSGIARSFYRVPDNSLGVLGSRVICNQQRQCTRIVNLSLGI